MTAAIWNVRDAQEIASRKLPKVAYDFICGGAEDEITVRVNERAFRRIAFRPRSLVDVSEIDQSVELFGQTLSMPVMIGPTGLARVAGHGGETSGARAARRARTMFTLSCMSSRSIEAVSEAVEGGAFWFQIYLWRDKDVVERLVQRAERAGATALVVTVDVPITGRRERDLRHGFSIPPTPTVRMAFDMMRHPRWLWSSLNPPIAFSNFSGGDGAGARKTIGHAKFINEKLSNPGATYGELDWLRERWPGPLLVKGVMVPEVAAELVGHGVDGIVVSNHGGRQLDGTLASIDALTDVVRAVGGRVDVFLDGGVRRGSDVIKAIALGAKACFIGRPWLYGLASNGENGVVAVLELLRDEIQRTMMLLGRKSLSELDESVISFERAVCEPEES